LTFIKPFAGYDESVGLIHITLEVTDFSLVDKAGQPNLPGEGHIIYYFNVKPPTTTGQPAFTSEGTYAISASVTYNWRDVGLGKYVLYAQLVNNDNTPFESASCR